MLPAMLPRRVAALLTASSRPRASGGRGFRPAPLRLKVQVFKLADLSEGIYQVDIVDWIIKEGDRVKEFDTICEVQTDKATMPITSPYAGVVTKVYFKRGDVAKVGEPLMEVEDGVAADALGTAPLPTAPSAVDPPRASGPAPTTPREPMGLQAVLPSSPPVSMVPPGKVLTSPAVRAVAKEHGLDLTRVPATGPHGRIVKDDVLRYLQAISSPAAQPPPSVLAAPPAAPAPGDRVEPLNAVYRSMFKAMTQALAIPTFSCGDAVEVDELVRLRQKCRPLLEARAQAEGRPAPPLSFLPFVVKGCSLALRRFPRLNATLRPEAMELTLRARHNIGIAMDTPAGLVVPNIKDVQSKSIYEIACELSRLQALALGSKLSAEDLQDGTFTLSNIGAIGTTWAVPVVFPPQVAIGAVSKVERVPRCDAAGAVVPRHVMTFGWSADHRVVDGATMVRFSNLLMSYLRDPETMLLDL